MIEECNVWKGIETMPLFMVKKRVFDQYKSGKRSVELRNVQPQWKNSRVGNEVVLMSGPKRILRKRILKIHRGSLSEIMKKVDYRRIFPDAKDEFEASGMVREIYPEDKEFMAFELL
jgi:ASC-1-like (ASCH) protein